jgi:yecA family protein
MDENVEFNNLEEALNRCGASWDAAQTHGLLTGRLAVMGVPAGPDWLLQVLAGTEDGSVLRRECEGLLDTLYQSTFWQLSERLSEFAPLLPHDDEDVGLRTAALAHWCEGFLHGLVSVKHADALKERLADEPLADIIKDMLQMTRAGLDEECDDESNDAAYADLVEYLRVVAQLSYEELAEFRNERKVKTNE